MAKPPQPTKKKRTKKPQATNDKPLQQRLEEVEAWIARHKDIVASAKKDRAAALAPYEEICQSQAARRVEAQRAVDRLNEAILAEETKMRALNVKLELLHKEHARLIGQREIARQADESLGEAFLSAFDALRGEKRHWVRRLRKQFASGEWRRKQRLRRKLLRRIAKKKERALKPSCTAEEMALGMLPADKVAESEAE